MINYEYKRKFLSKELNIMSKPKMRQFMGSKQDQKEHAVTISYDPSVIKSPKNKKNIKLIDDTNTKIGNDISNMSLAMSLGKDERIFKMVTEYDKGNVLTISSIAQLLDVTYATAKKYAKEAGIKIYDDKLQKYTDGRLPKNIQ